MHKEYIIFIFILPLSILIPVVSLLLFNHEFLFVAEDMNVRQIRKHGVCKQ